MCKHITLIIIKEIPILKNKKPFFTYQSGKDLKEELCMAQVCEKWHSCTVCEDVKIGKNPFG